MRTVHGNLIVIGNGSNTKGFEIYRTDKNGLEIFQGYAGPAEIPAHIRAAVSKHMRAVEADPWAVYARTCAVRAQAIEAEWAAADASERG